MDEKIRRRNLSGIYIFEIFPEETKRKPTSFEDCTEETQDRWLESLHIEALRNLAKMLGKKLREVGDTFDLMSGGEDE